MIYLEMSIFAVVSCQVIESGWTQLYFTPFSVSSVEDIGQTRVGLCVPALADLSEHL